MERKSPTEAIVHYTWRKDIGFFLWSYVLLSFPQFYSHNFHIWEISEGAKGVTTLESVQKHSLRHSPSKELQFTWTNGAVRGVVGLLARGHCGERWDIHYGNWDTLCLSEDVCPLVSTDSIDTSPLGIFAEVMQLCSQCKSQNPTGMESIS